MELPNFATVAKGNYRAGKPLSLPLIGVLVSGLLIGCGLVFRTYTISMSSAPWEAARQLGLPFITVEVAVILFALRRDFSLRTIWQQIPRFPRYSLTCFFGLYWIGATFVSELGLIALAQNIIILVHLIFCAAIYHSVASINRDGLHDMAKMLAIGLLIFAGMTALAFINHPPLESMPNNQIIWQFIIPGFISVRLFGAFCGAVFSFLLVQLLMDEQERGVSVHQYLWLTLCAGLIIWSGTRAAVLGTGVAFAVALIGYNIRPRKVRTIAAISGCLITAYVLATALVPYGDTNFMLIAPSEGTTPEAVSGGRLSYWSAVWEAFRTVPFFGAGPFASFWMLEPPQSVHVQPHNIILQFLISWGSFATVAGLLALGFATWKAHVIVFAERDGLPFLAMLDSLLAMSLVDGMMHFAQHFMLIMICFGVIFSLTKTDEKDQVALAKTA